MSFVSDIWKGINLGSKLPLLAVALLIIQVILTSVVGAASWSWMGDTIGHSVNTSKLILGYNHDVVQDLINQESTGYDIIKKIGFWIMFLFILISPFTSASIVGCIINSRNDFNAILAYGAKYYFKFLGLLFIHLMMHLILLGILGYVGLMVLNNGLDYFISELPVLYLLGFLLLLYIIKAIIFISASVNAKQLIIREDLSVLTAFWHGLNHTLSRKFHYILLGISFLLISLIVAFLANVILNCIQESSLLMVLLALLVQGVILFLRNMIRVMYYASILK